MHNINCMNWHVIIIALPGRAGRAGRPGSRYFVVAVLQERSAARGAALAPELQLTYKWQLTRINALSRAAGPSGGTRIRTRL